MLGAKKSKDIFALLTSIIVFFFFFFCYFTITFIIFTKKRDDLTIISCIWSIIVNLNKLHFSSFHLSLSLIFLIKQKKTQICFILVTKHKKHKLFLSRHFSFLLTKFYILPLFFLSYKHTHPCT